jgi:hypothetical protein
MAQLRKDFPILNSKIGPKKIPAMFVYAHKNQCDRNHGQTVDRLAERGGLSWCELFAVLHDVRWRSMNEQEAHDCCMTYMATPEAQNSAALFASDETKIVAEPEVKPDHRYRFVWLNLADGTFSESWLEGEHPPGSSLHEEKLAAEANDRNTLFKLIKYTCLNDGNFAFDNKMRLR